MLEPIRPSPTIPSCMGEFVFINEFLGFLTGLQLSIAADEVVR